MLVSLAVCCITLAQADTEMRSLVSFEPGAPTESMTAWRTQVRMVEHESVRAVEARFDYPGWACVAYKSPEGQPWDWRGWDAVEIGLHNPEEDPLMVNLTVDSLAQTGERRSTWSGCVVPAGGTNTIVLHLNGRAHDGLWGMRALPGSRLATTGLPVDLSRVTQFYVYPVWVERPVTLQITGARLLRGAAAASPHVPRPIVDAFGQFAHGEWPGRLGSEDELQMRRIDEEAELAAEPAVEGWDDIGGWASGPQLEATGWFRTERVDGTWWLVTPQGRLFFSTGVNALNLHHYPTFIDNRPDWFAWMPEQEGAFASCFQRNVRVHSMAEGVNESTRAFYFHRANVIRRYGDAWEDGFRNTVYRRLRAWGFNTIGNWADFRLYQHSNMPFVISVWPGHGEGYRRVEGGGGYWYKMPDVFDPDWEVATRDSVREAAEARGWRGNPLCMGYTVDNELPWEQVAPGVLPSPPDQPCRIALIERLQAKYGSLEALDAAWGTTSESWDALRSPEEPNDAYRADLDAFVYAFARRYFETIARLIDEYAPNQLYFGCRFAFGDFVHPEAERACAELCDVMTYNLYRRRIDPAAGNGPKDRGKPVLISEFSFGATDRGLFHPGFIAVNDQADRGRHYVQYVTTAAQQPHVVGCHWYMYRDAPVTGAAFDGDCSNYGLVDVTDSPYPELIAAARQVHEQVYSLRASR